MSKHTSDLATFKARTEGSEYNPLADQKDKDLALTMVFHISDISNSTKPWELCRHWTEILFTEFFNQGDYERQRGNPITFLMERSTVNIAKS
jgi:hypothetical protein